MKRQFNRIPHIMKARKRTEMITNCMFFDCETRDIYEGNDRRVQRHKFWFGYAIAWRIEHRERSKIIIRKLPFIETFYSTLEKRLVDKKPLYVFAHNLPFDLTVVDFWNQSLRLGISIDYIVADDPPCILRCSWNNKQIIFIDTLNFWRAKLASLGKNIGIKKHNMPKKGATYEKWENYCKNDCHIISEAIYNLIQFVRSHDLGGIGLTAPSLAMNAYKRRFMKHQIWIHDNNKALQLERESYYGGRVQCFQIGECPKQPYYYLDVNSLYPFVMQKDYPTKLLGVVNEPSLSLCRELVNRYIVVGRIYIDQSKIAFPKRFHERLCFVTGKYNTTLCGKEFERALDTNSILYIDRIAYYEAKPIFKTFVDFFWNLRKEYQSKNDNVNQLFCKLLMNSLYGKFGQNGVTWINLDYDSFQEYLDIMKAKPILKQYDPESLLYEVDTTAKWIINGLNDPIQLRRIGNNVQIRFPLLEHSESFPAIASCVTSYAREYLLELINAAGERNVFYCDTDSLFVNKQGYTKLRRSGFHNKNALGKLKTEFRSTSLTIFGPKDYIFGSAIKRKGIREEAIETSPGTFRQLQFEGLKSIMKRGGDAFIDIETIEKTNKRIFTKGTIERNGRISLYHLNEIPITSK